MPATFRSILPEGRLLAALYKKIRVASLAAQEPELSMVPFKPMNIKEVAQIMDVCERTVRNMIDAGEITPPKKVGGHSLWHPDVFWAWFDDYLRPPERDECPDRPESQSPENQSQRPAYTAARHSAVPKKGKKKTNTSGSVMQQMHALVSGGQGGKFKNIPPPSPPDAAVTVNPLAISGTALTI